MDPACSFRIRGPMRRVRSHTAFRSTARTWSHWSSVIRQVMASRVIPAQLTRISTRSHRVVISSTARRQSSGRARSARRRVSPARSASAGAISRPMTWAPWSRKASAMALPMPLAAPVTTARLFLRSMAISPFAPEGTRLWRGPFGDILCYGTPLEFAFSL